MSLAGVDSARAFGIGGLVLVALVLLGPGRGMTAWARIRQLEVALTFFEMDNGRYPTTEEGLSALVQPPPALGQTWRAGGYLQGGVVPNDSWSRPFNYACPPTRNAAGFDLWSLGSDGAPGGEGSDADVGNWPGGFPEYDEGYALLSMTTLERSPASP